MNNTAINVETKRNLILSLCQAITACNNLDDAARLVEDLLSEQEAVKLAKRLMAAQLLIKKYSYKEIKEILQVGENTIAKVNIWLKHSGEGYRKAALKIKPLTKPQIVYPFIFEELKRRRPANFTLTNLLVDQLIEGAYKRKKNLSETTLSRLKKKSAITKLANPKNSRPKAT